MDLNFGEQPFKNEPPAGYVGVCHAAADRRAANPNCGAAAGAPVSLKPNAPQALVLEVIRRQNLYLVLLTFSKTVLFTFLPCFTDYHIVERFSIRFPSLLVEMIHCYLVLPSFSYRVHRFCPFLYISIWSCRFSCSFSFFFSFPHYF